MRQFSTAWIEEKNRLEGRRAYAHLVEIEVNANTTAYFTSHPETLTWNSRVYAPAPIRIGDEELAADGALPRMNVRVGNTAGLAFKFAKDNDLALNDVWIRTINTNLPNSGDDARIKMQILGSGFTEEIAQFSLGLGFTYDAEGPLRVYNRVDHPCIPVNFRNYFTA